MHKLVGPDWNKKPVTEITKAVVEKLLNKIAAGRAQSSKARSNSRAGEALNAPRMRSSG
jgi:hypothetical protein